MGRLRTRSFHTAALTSTGRLLAFGDNSYGQLGSALRDVVTTQPRAVARKQGPARNSTMDMLAACPYCTCYSIQGPRSSKSKRFGPQNMIVRL